jgi:chloramphenicol 3-O phosphotransferase
LNGKVILLNGTSSSGKTSIAKSLQEILDEPFLNFPIDFFINFYIGTLPKRFFPPPVRSNLSFKEGLDFRDREEHFIKLLSGFHQCIVALSRTGINLIIDHVLETKLMLEHCVETLCGLPVLFVGIQCPLEELKKREKERKDRTQGMAENQIELVHKYTIYHIQVDSSVSNPMECARKIKTALNEKGNFLSESFNELKERMLMKLSKSLQD